MRRSRCRSRHPGFHVAGLSLGPFDLDIRWYALAYIAGLVLGWRYCLALARKPPRVARPEDIDDFLVWATLGVVLGGRTGYVLFYRPDFYFAHPDQILAIWHGGMSFHGGALGVLAALALFCRQRGIPLLGLSDIIACAVPIGLFFGRIANFINDELWGRPTDVPWAMVFPTGGPLPRHPSQLYEATLEGIVLFTVLFLLQRSRRLRERQGTLTGVFLIGYALARIILRGVPRARRQSRLSLSWARRWASFCRFPCSSPASASVWYAWKRPAPRVSAAGRASRAHLAARIAAAGPISVASYMEAALFHPRWGYYATRDPLGARGDFITAPEVSQVFGELIGLWCADSGSAWARPTRSCSPSSGPGRGTLMRDALRAAAVVPGFARALRLHLVERSPVLRAAQLEALRDAAPQLHDDAATLPPGPLLLVANEFLDALPIRQYERVGGHWHERRIAAGNGGTFRFVRDPVPATDAGADVPEGSIRETRPAAQALAQALGARLAREEGQRCSSTMATKAAVATRSRRCGATARMRFWTHRAPPTSPRMSILPPSPRTRRLLARALGGRSTQGGFLRVAGHRGANRGAGGKGLSRLKRRFCAAAPPACRARGDGTALQGPRPDPSRRAAARRVRAGRARRRGMMLLQAGALAVGGIRHAFFTRDGGASEGVFASLNCSLGSGDDAGKVDENRRRAARRLGVAPDRLVTPYQVHGAAVAAVAQPWRQADRPRADALMTRAPGIALGILTADCAPVLFADPTVPMVAAAHAGWRGAVGGVIEATLAAMEQEGATRASIRAAIGPCIGGPSYEVGPEFPAPFLAESADNMQFFMASPRAGALALRSRPLCRGEAAPSRDPCRRAHRRRHLRRVRTVLLLSPRLPRGRAALRPSTVGDLPCPLSGPHSSSPRCCWPLPANRCRIPSPTGSRCPEGRRCGRPTASA